MGKGNKLAYDITAAVSTADWITPLINITLSLKRVGKGDKTFFVPDHYGNTRRGWNARAIERDLKALGINPTEIPVISGRDELVITVKKEDFGRVQDFFARAEIDHWPYYNADDTVQNNRLSSGSSNERISGLSEEDSRRLRDELNDYWKDAK